MKKNIYRYINYYKSYLIYNYNIVHIERILIENIVYIKMK
jgi:hypothetical protein